MERRLAERRSAGNYRILKQENALIDFCSNDYLGFAKSADLKEAINAQLKTTPNANGSTGSRLISGNLTFTENVERKIASTFNAEAALLFNSGYDANLGLLSAILQKGDTVICDELIHASAIDGARLSHANRFSFKHNDVDALEQKLVHAKGNIYVIVESVYSMDGDSPPLFDIATICDKYNANLIVDEAHAVGLYKKGIVCHLNLEYRVFARVITFGKALGCHGAAVIGSETLRNYLINFARSFIYTTAAPFHQVTAINASLDLLEKSDETIINLKNNVVLFKGNCSIAVLQMMPQSESAIQCIILKSNEKAAKLSATLINEGFDVRAILSPTVATGSERLRICLHTFNTGDQILKLTEILNLQCHEA